MSSATKCSGSAHRSSQLALRLARCMLLDYTLWPTTTPREGGRKAGPIGQLPQKERWHWLVAPRSTIIQTSPVHSGLCEDPTRALEHLMDTMVRLRPKAAQAPK